MGPTARPSSISRTNNTNSRKHINTPPSALRTHGKRAPSTRSPLNKSTTMAKKRSAQDVLSDEHSEEFVDFKENVANDQLLSLPLVEDWRIRTSQLISIGQIKDAKELLLDKIEDKLHPLHWTDYWKLADLLTKTDSIQGHLSATSLIESAPIELQLTRYAPIKLILLKGNFLGHQTEQLIDYDQEALMWSDVPSHALCVEKLYQLKHDQEFGLLSLAEQLIMQSWKKAAIHENISFHPNMRLLWSFPTRLMAYSLQLLNQNRDSCRKALFELSQDMLDTLVAKHEKHLSPAQHSLVWFTVSIYYWSIGRIADARRFMRKAIQGENTNQPLDAHHVSTWEDRVFMWKFAHLFCLGGDHEQASMLLALIRSFFERKEKNGANSPENAFYALLHARELLHLREFDQVRTILDKTRRSSLNEKSLVQLLFMNVKTELALYTRDRPQAKEIASSSWAIATLDSDVKHALDIFLTGTSHSPDASFIASKYRLSLNDSTHDSSKPLVASSPLATLSFSHANHSPRHRLSSAGALFSASPLVNCSTAPVPFDSDDQSDSIDALLGMTYTADNALLYTRSEMDLDDDQ